MRCPNCSSLDTQVKDSRPAEDSAVIRRRRVCVKRTRRNRGSRRCTRYVRAGRTLTRTSKAGRNRVKFTGRIGRRALKPGRYRLTIVATDAAGNRSRARRLNFRIVKP